MLDSVPAARGTNGRKDFDSKQSFMDEVLGHEAEFFKVD